jgi:RHS repeat-associated protein
MLSYATNGFNKLLAKDTYIFVTDARDNILADNGKTGTPQDVEKAAAYELVQPCLNDLINHFLGRTVDNSHILGIGEGQSQDTLDYSGNSDILVISPDYFYQKHVYTDRGQRVMQKTSTAMQTGGSGGNIKLLYVHEDIMGNTRYHTKASGRSYAELEYDVWGNPTSPSMLLNNDNGVFIFAKFTGHVYDTVLDIYFAQARFYDAKNRQWLNSDPMKDGLNWYVYVGGNPVSFVDPWGLVPVTLIDYARAMGATVNEYTKDGEAYAKITYGGINKNYIVNSGIMDDEDINAAFGFESFLTDEEREAGVGIYIKGNALLYDITEPVKNALLRDVGLFEAKGSESETNLVEKNLWFAKQVGDEGPWNLKRFDGKEYTWVKTLGIPLWDYQMEMYLHGYFVKVECVGNITYGYLGAAMGFGQNLLNVGSAANHIKNHGIFDWDNELADQEQFPIGIGWYESGEFNEGGGE